MLSAIKPKATDASSNGSGTEAEPAAVQVKSGPPALPSPVMKASGPPPGFGPPAVSGPPGFGPPRAAPAAAAGPVASAAAVQQQVAEEEAPIKLELNLAHILPSEQHSIGFFPTASPDKMSLPRPPQVPVDDNSSLTLPMMLPLSRDGLLSHQPVQQPQHNLGNSRLHQQQQQQHGQQQQQHGAIGSPLQLSGQPPSIAGYRDPWGISLGHHHPAAAMSSPSLWGNNSGFGEGSGGGGGGGGPPSFSQWREEIMLAPPVTPVNPAHIPHHQQQGVNADFLASAMMSALSTGEAVRPSPPPGMTRPAVNAAAVSAVQPAPATDKQKTAAMMSLLKSKAGDQFMSAAPRKSSPDSQAVSAAPNLAPVAANAVHGSSAIQEAMQKDASDATSAAAVVAALEETVAASMPAAFVKRPPPLTRTVKNQRCQLIIKVRNFRSGEQEVLPVGYYFRPGNGMTVEYRLPIDLFESLYAGRSKTDSATVPIAVGLFRYGSQANNAPIVAKNITFTPPYTRIEDRHTKQVYVVSSMQFFAPRAPGQFIYRLYNNETRESSMETMATSTMFSVVLVEQDIISSLQHVKEAFDEAGIPPSNGNRMRTGSDLGTGTATANPTSNSLINKAIAQLGQAIRGIKACSVVTREVSPLLSRCVERVLDEVNASLMILEEGQEKKRLLKLTQQLTLEGESKLPLEGEDKILLVGDKIPLPGDIVEEINETVEQAEFWRSYRNAHKLQQDCYDTLSILIDKKTAWYLITEKLKNTIRFLLGLYCPVLRRFARSQHELQKLRIEVLFFVPASDPKTQNPNPNFQILPSQTQMFLDQAIRFLLPSLLPDNHFYEKREQTRIMIERQLLDSGAMPVGSTLAVYGSSGNGFGSSASDLDMCLLLPAAVTTAAAAASSASTATQQAQQQAQQAQQQQEERIHHLEQISLALASSGFDHISTRLTARVPIIEFFDPLSNLDCDISLHNALALANTKLLRSYSDCDPRVKILAALIKYWARRRHLNSPADGTLSSYGYVLSLIFFLQNRPVPMLLNLQRLPPNWRGEKVDNKSSSSGGTGVPKTMEKNMSNDQLCDVYCLQPNPKQMELLQVSLYFNFTTHLSCHATSRRSWLTYPYHCFILCVTILYFFILTCLLITPCIVWIEYRSAEYREHTHPPDRILSLLSLRLRHAIRCCHHPPSFSRYTQSR